MKEYYCPNVELEHVQGVLDKLARDSWQLLQVVPNPFYGNTDVTLYKTVKLILERDKEKEKE